MSRLSQALPGARQQDQPADHHERRGVRGAAGGGQQGHQAAGAGGDREVRLSSLPHPLQGQQAPVQSPLRFLSRHRRGETMRPES